MTDYLAYEGSEFTIEWYQDSKGKSQAMDYFLAQPKEAQRKVLNLFRLMGDHGKIHDETKFRNEGDAIYAFKPQPHRYLCFFFKGKKIIVTNAFIKKTQKLPKAEKEKAILAYECYEQRIKGGSYYDA